MALKALNNIKFKAQLCIDPLKGKLQKFYHNIKMFKRAEIHLPLLNQPNCLKTALKTILFVLTTSYVGKANHTERFTDLGKLKLHMVLWF